MARFGADKYKIPASSKPLSFHVDFKGGRVCPREAGGQNQKDNIHLEYAEKGPFLDKVWHRRLMSLIEDTRDFSLWRPRV